MGAEQPGKVLLVDDETDFLDLAAGLFSTRGFEVDVAKDGAQALEKIAQEDYEAAIVDLKMPDQNGVELASELLKVDPSLSVSVLSSPAHMDVYKGIAEDENIPISNWFEKPLPVQEDKLEEFFARIELDIFRSSLRRSGREDVLTALSCMLQGGGLSAQGVMNVIKAYDLHSDYFAATRDLIAPLQERVEATLHDYEDMESRLENIILLKKSLSALIRSLAGGSFEALKDAAVLVYSALQNIYAEDISKVQLRAVAQVVSIMASGRVGSEEIRKMDMILLGMGLDVIPDIREE